MNDYWIAANFSLVPNCIGVRMRPEMGRSTEGTVNRSMSRNRGNTPERKERKRGWLITHLRKAREQKKVEMALNLASWGSNSMESREGMIDGENNVTNGQHWISGGWDISCGSVQPAIKTSRTSEKKKMLDLQIYLHSNSWRWSGGMRWPRQACRMKYLFKKRGFGDTLVILQ